MVNVSEHGNQTTFHQSYSCLNYLNGVQNNIISSLNALIAITAFLGNFLIVIALQKVTSLHPPSKFLFSGLSSTDLCVGRLFEPLYIAYFLTPAHSELCNYVAYVTPMLAFLFCGESLLTSTAMSLDRLLALTLVLTYRHTVTTKRVWAFVFVSWLGSSACAMVFLFDGAIPMYIVCVVVLLCVSTSTFCYVKIYRTLHHHQSQADHIYAERSSRREILLNIARYRKTLSSALWVSVVFVTCYLPFAAVTLTGYITNIYTPSFDLFSELAITLVQFNSSLNPLLYCWKIRELRQAVKNTIKQFFCFWS